MLISAPCALCAQVVVEAAGVVRKACHMLMSGAEAQVHICTLDYMMEF